MNEYTFWNPTTGEEIDIDAYGFEEMVTCCMLTMS